jgi:DNA-binding NarL/FixJ family response regulator
VTPSDNTGLEKTKRLKVHYGLIVEDLPDARDWLLAAMGEAFPGIEIDTAASLADAREHVRGRLPQVALIDIGLPDGSGIDLIAKGYTTAKVADFLNITRNTASGYVKQIYSKLNISSRAEAALEASRRGIVSPEAS